MKQVVLGLSLFVLLMVLSACGLIKAFIPDQKISDPLGLDGQELELTQTGAFLQTQAVTVVFGSEFNESFNDFDDSSVPSGLEPSGLSEDIAIETTFTVSSSEAETAFPSTATIVASELNLTLTNAGGSPQLSKSYNSSNNLSYVFNKGTCSSVGALTSCPYTTTITAVDLLKLNISGSDFKTLYFNILTDGNQPNSLTGNFKISLESDVAFPSDSVVTVTLSLDEATLTF